LNVLLKPIWPNLYITINRVLFNCSINMSWKGHWLLDEWLMDILFRRHPTVRFLQAQNMWKAHFCIISLRREIWDHETSLTRSTIYWSAFQSQESERALDFVSTVFQLDFDIVMTICFPSFYQRQTDDV